MYPLAPLMEDDNSKIGSEPGNNAGVNTIVRPEEKTELKRPSMYKVILLNDDYTPMDFVVNILKKFFTRTETEATQIMMNVHHQGRGIAGVYAYEVAETKAYQVQNYAKLREFPLKCIIEKE
ncbi:MAG: ATP-dependent Clp protease adapter ClpS [Pseudomonadota bacterium]|nr:ATP-dependent Clp protease adapter ClpS [Pseudomonadota bacterium]